MSRQDAILLDESLGAGDVSMAWAVWSRAAETALGDAYGFSGGPIPGRGLVLGRGVLCFGLSGLVVTRFGRHVVMLLTLLMILMFSCTVTLPLLLCFICGVGSKLS